MTLRTLGVVRQEPKKPDRLRKIPLYGQGTLSWACKNGTCAQCTKLSCPCECGHK